MDVLTPQPVINNSHVTEVKSIITNLSWTIKNFESIYSKAKLISPSWTSSTSSYGEITWNLELSPYGGEKSTKSSIALYLAANCDKRDIEAHFMFATITENKKMNKQSGVKRFIPAKWGFHNFLKRDDQYNRCLEQGNLVVYCEVKVMNSILNFPAQTDSIEIPGSRLSLDWNILFKNKKFCDVTLAVDGQMFEAHKVVLAARSAVFSAMFEHEMSENQNNRVDIADMKPEVLNEMLRFIYTGTTGNIDVMACDLLAAADKYDLMRLKKMCESALCRSLSLESVVVTLIAADLHSSSHLKAEAIKYMVNHAKDLEDTAEFKSLCITHPRLMIEVFVAKSVNS